MTAMAPMPMRHGLAVPGLAEPTSPAQPIRALRRSQAAFPAAVGAHVPGFPAPALRHPSAIILVMAALTARTHPGTRAGAGTSQRPIQPTGLGSARPVVPGHPSERHVRTACHQRSRTSPGSVIPAGGQLRYPLAATPKEAPAGLSTAAAMDGAGSARAGVCQPAARLGEEPVLHPLIQRMPDHRGQ